MEVRQSYRIWFSQRNGSTLLCKGLEQTGIAGKPGEFFNISNDSSFAEHYGISNWEELRTRLWQEGTSNNGIFGIKHSWMTDRYTHLLAEIHRLKGLDAETLNAQELLDDLFPNCRHIYVTRRNKIRQAVSWWKAIQDQVWHLAPGQTQKDEQRFFDEHYNFDAIHHLFREASLRECAIQAYFSEFGIAPLTLVYEDFVQDFSGTLRQVVDYLEIDSDALQLPKPYYHKTANAGSEQWVQRFRQELQEKLGKQIW